MSVEKTVVHLIDKNGWHKTIEYLGDREYSGIFMERRVPDLSKEFGELIPDDRKFYVKDEWITKMAEMVYVKYLIFQER